MDLDRLRSALRDRYELERELGSGGMATVYLATDLKHDRKVAIKVLRPELAASLGTDRFLHEIEIAAKLQHPHILMLIDSGDAAGLPYYVMPYIDGESLREKLDREKQLPIEVALQIARQVAAALAHAHKHGVIHRDIKPANILLAGDDVVVADFGIARAVSQAERRELTETGMVLGTPTYMSPEQIASRDAVDGRTDIYALACVLYEMLAGEPPFGGHSAQVIMARHAIDPPPPLRTVRTSVPISLENALFTAMQKSPADRYSSATHFSQVLLECGREISGAFTPPDLPEPTIDTQPSEESSKGLASPRLRDFALGAVLVAVLVVIFGQPWTRPAAEQTGALNPFVASVAVMPFLNQTGDAELDMVGDVLTGEIIAHLSEIDTLKVISLESVLLLRDRELSPPEISEVLGVEHIILGTLRSDASGVSVSAQLTTGRDEATLWSESFEDDPSNSQGLERIATIVTERYVASVGGVSFIPRPRHVVLTPGTVSYQLGVEWLQMRTPRGINNAISSFGEAIAIDSSLAKAYAGLSSALALALTYRYETGLDGYRQAGLAFAAATKAVELNPGEAEGFSARGYIASRAHAPLTQVVVDFVRAQELRPNESDVPGWYAWVLSQQGNSDLAVSEAQRAIQLDPLSPSRRVSLGLEALRLGRAELALEAATAGRRLEPELIMFEAIAAHALLLLGRSGECLDLRLGPHHGLRATCLYESGDTLAARRIIDSLIAATETAGRRPSPYTRVLTAEDIAAYFAWIGDPPRALRWVRRAFELSPMGIELRLLRSPVFDRVQRDAVFSREVDEILSAVWNRVLAESSI